MNRQTLETTIAGRSVYTQAPQDPQALYLRPGDGAVGDGVADDADAIQQAINAVKAKAGCGIVFLAEGRYRIGRTIFIPKAVRLIGHGQRRPTLVLGKQTPGFQTINPQDPGQARYMVWFVDRLSAPGEPVRDATPGTFYSALVNVNLVIEDANPCAAAIRAHFAQHSFVAHADIYIGQAKAGAIDIGNEFEDVRFFGGDYGIITRKTAPAWPFMLIDCHFENQRHAAIRTQEAGLTIVRMSARNVASVIETNPGFIEKLYMQDCQFENITGPALVISMENNSANQINLRNIACHQVPVLAHFRESGKSIAVSDETYQVESLTHGLQMSHLRDRPVIATTQQITPIPVMPALPGSDIPRLPSPEHWRSVHEFGAKGDNSTDDTAAIQQAIDQCDVVYLPQGRYRVSDTLRLRSNTTLIGLNPIATQIVLPENTEAFGGMGAQKPLVETAPGGRCIVSGIGVDTGARNPRAVGCKWTAGRNSYLNDVKFVGGHGSMNPDGSHPALYNPARTADADPDRRWDAQYPSLWITAGGGGIFRNLWTASPYASAGLVVSDTDTPSSIYGISSEHHVRNEAVFRNVSNFNVLALQLEEEFPEGPHCLPVQLDGCRDMRFANLFLFRTIRVDNPYPVAIKTWNCQRIELLNVHNYTQVKYTMDNTLVDMTSQIEVRPWQIARLLLKGDDHRPPLIDNTVQQLAGGFTFVDAICRDTRGNVYFVDGPCKRIYRWSTSLQTLQLISECHFRPLSIACDTQDNLLVVAEYFPPRGATINGQSETYAKPDDARGTSYGYWYNPGSTINAYAIDPQHPETSLRPLPLVATDSVPRPAKVLYPANRWRDSNDILQTLVQKRPECFLAPDGVTIIPLTYDLIRACSLQQALPGKVFYCCDEYYKRTIRCAVNQDGCLSNPEIFVDQGEYSATTDSAGQVYVADGHIEVFTAQGKWQRQIAFPQRPACLQIGGQGDATLFITARTGFYALRI